LCKQSNNQNNQACKQPTKQQNFKPMEAELVNCMSKVALSPQPFVLLVVQSVNKVFTSKTYNYTITYSADNDVQPDDLRIQCPGCLSFDCNAELQSYHDGPYHSVSSDCGEYFMHLEYKGNVKLDQLQEYEDPSMRVDYAPEVDESFGTVCHKYGVQRAFKVKLLQVCGVVPSKVFRNYECNETMTADQVLERVFDKSSKQLQKAKLHAKKVGFYDLPNYFVLPITPTYNLWEHNWPGDPTYHESYIQVFFTNNTNMCIWAD
jgi:hypothetical protein